LERGAGFEPTHSALICISVLQLKYASVTLIDYFEPPLSHSGNPALYFSIVYY